MKRSFILPLLLFIALLPLSTLEIRATASYTISISVSPTSGNVGDSFTVTASVSISGMETGTAYVILKTVAPDGSYAYYANSAWSADDGGVPPYRQWVPDDMPVSQSYSWTVTANQEGSYVSSITIVIDGDAPGGHLEDSKSATFTATSSGGGGGSNVWIDVSVSPSSVQQGGSVTITVTTSDYLPPNPQIVTSVYPPGSSSPAASYSGKGTFTFNVPSNAQTGTWTVKGVIKDSSGNAVAQDQATFSVTSSGGSDPPTTQSWIRIKGVNPSSPYEGQETTFYVRYNYAGDEIHKRVRLVISHGANTELMKSAQAGKHDVSFTFTPETSGTYYIYANLEERRWDPVNGYYWSSVASDSYTLLVNAKMDTELILNFPSKVHVGDTISITVKLMCGGSELNGKTCKLYIDQGEHTVQSGSTFQILAERTGTIDVSAEFEGDEAHKPSQNGGGLIEVWTRPTIEITSISCSKGD